MDLHVLGFPEHDATIFSKYLSTRDTNFVVKLAQVLMDGIS